MSAAPIQVQIAYAKPHCAMVKTLRLAPGSRIADALRLAALDPDFSDVDFAHAPVGIFGRMARAEDELQEGDRIEIYRPLAADPKSARRARAQQARKNPRPR